MGILLTELKRRWKAMFDALAAGDDVPPSLRLRAEGMMESVLLLDDVGSDDVDAAMGECYEASFGRSLEADFGADWREFYPFPQIPAMGRRAPVVPSTND